MWWQTSFKKCWPATLTCNSDGRTQKRTWTLTVVMHSWGDPYWQNVSVDVRGVSPVPKHSSSLRPDLVPGHLRHRSAKPAVLPGEAIRHLARGWAVWSPSSMSCCYLESRKTWYIRTSWTWPVLKGVGSFTAVTITGGHLISLNMKFCLSKTRPDRRIVFWRTLRGTPNCFLLHVCRELTVSFILIVFLFGPLSLSHLPPPYGFLCGDYLLNQVREYAN